jgi:hypothetical protein
MATVRSLFQITHKELISKPALRRFLPCLEQTIRGAWFEWYWLGHCLGSQHTLLVGPFRTRRGARRAWDKVPETVEFDTGEGHKLTVRAVDLESPGPQYQMNQSFSDYHKG